MKVRNPPQALTRVEFYIDEQKIGEDTQAPYSLQFNTDSYPLGIHSLKAVGIYPDGKEITSNTIQSNFVPASAATDFLKKLLLPILGLFVLIMGIAVGLPLALNKGKVSHLPSGTQRNYGIGGGAVCPKCGRPFPLRLWFINLGFHKIDRCPYCGKWSLVRPSSLAELRAAEAAELAIDQPQQPISKESEADKLSKELDDSKYQNL
jgi:hypothetical protein